MTPPQTRRWLAPPLLLLCAALAGGGRRPPAVRPSAPDFTCARALPDGEVERRAHRGQVAALETTVEMRGRSHEYQLLTWLQVSDGRHFIQLIYDSSSELRDCEYLKSQDSVERFYESFAQDRDCPPRTAAAAPEASRSPGPLSAAPDNFTADVDYARLHRECKTLHKRIRQTAEKQLRKDKKKPDGGGEEELLRLRRDLFLYPGTNWCGSGSNARKFNELGYNAAADRCCRDHDHCPHTIEGFTSEYNFFNFRFHTVSHCDCDERFRACLKLSGTAAGNMVGKLFFNVVQTKCFLFKHVRKCIKRSWWGKCIKYEKEKTAILREALKY